MMAAGEGWRPRSVEVRALGPESPYGRCELCGEAATAVIAPVVRTRRALHPAPPEGRCAQHLRRPGVTGPFTVLSPAGVLTEGARWGEVLAESGAASVRLARLLMTDFPLPVLVVDERAVCLLANDRWERLTGWGMGQAQVRRSWLRPFPLAVRHQLLECLRTPALGTGPAFELEAPVQAPGAGERQVTLRGNLLPPDGSGRQVWLLTAVDGTGNQITRARESVSSLLDLATSTPSVPLLREHVRHALARLGRGADSFVVLAVVLGARGDGVRESTTELLRNLARRLRAVLRTADVVSRAGDEELLLLCEGVRTYREAEILLARVATAFDTPVSAGGRRVRVDAAFGVAFPHHPTDDPDRMIARARSASALARTRGGGAHEIVIGAGAGPEHERAHARR
jgi:PAS domain-containing protein